MSQENSTFAIVLSLAIAAVSLSIIFNFASIHDESKSEIAKNNYKKIEKQLWENRIENSRGITGMVVADEANKTLYPEPQKEQLYSEKSYMMYYLLLTFIGLFIAIVAIGFFLPKLKFIN